MALVYNVNNTATQVLAAKQVKENIFVNLLHHNGKGVTQQTETNVSTLRMLKVIPNLADARQLNAATNGDWFNIEKAQYSNVSEYDLNLLYVYDRCADLPEVQQDMCPANLFDNTTKNIGGRIATEINASTIAHQLSAVFNAANTANAWTNLAVVLAAETTTTKPDYYGAIQDASTMLDDGDSANFIQSFPFDEREIIMRPQFRSKLMSANGVLIGGSNYAQSMIAKGTVSPDASKDFGNMYVGEIDMIPCHVAPKAIWDRASEWVGTTATAFDSVQAIVCAASATDRGISTQGYIKTIDSPDGAGKRLQPLTRWGVNVCYPKGIVPIVSNGTTVPASQLTVTAPGSRQTQAQS